MHESAGHCDAMDAAEAAAPDVAEVTQAVAVVLSLAKLPLPADGALSLTPLSGGRNNRVYRVALDDRQLVAKVYFEHPDDPRPRLEAEFSFIKHVWSLGLRNLPQPIARLPMKQLGVYSLLPGAAIAPGQVTRDHVTQAAAFVREINLHREKFAGQRSADHELLEERPCIAHASDACFTLGDHLASIEARFSRLLAMAADSPSRKAAASFVETKLLPAWREATGQFRNDLKRAQMTMGDQPCLADIVLSPSDFGFHNALVDDDGRVAFHDFEYAGWDDPAKLVCDFFTQVAVPAPADALDDFLAVFLPVLTEPDATIARVKMLLPLYRLKWCAMPLMDLLPVSDARRSFAAGSNQQRDTHAQQQQNLEQKLEEAQRLFESL